jgi:hypothetical protein
LHEGGWRESTKQTNEELLKISGTFQLRTWTVSNCRAG